VSIIVLCILILSISLFLVVYFIIISSILLNSLLSLPVSLQLAALAISFMKHDIHGLRRRKSIGRKKERKRKGMEQEALYSLHVEKTENVLF
jgi:membrane protein implicated in regulation of membrane protease activity